MLFSRISPISLLFNPSIFEDLSGSSVYKSQLAIGSHNIDLSKYADGVYLLEAANENGSQVIRLIKE